MVPSMNNAYPSNKFGKRFKSVEFQRWERDFKMWCLTNAREVSEARQAFAHPKPGRIVVIHAQYFFARESILCLNGKPKRNDTSNRLKILHDAVAGAIWLDDSYFFDGTFTKRALPDSGKKIHEYCNVILEWTQAEWMLPGSSRSE